MPSFSPTDAAFEGFRITRERPWAVAAWAGLYLVAGMASVLLMVATVGPKLAVLQAASHNTNDPAAAAAQFQQLAPFLALALPLVLVFQSIMICAVYRAVLRPQDLVRGYVKIGRDELRMMALSLFMGVLASAALFVVLFVDEVVAVVLHGVGGGAGALLALIVALASLCAMVWLGVRASLAGPMTFMTGELHILRAWALTRGQFWRLFGAYVLAGLLSLIVVLLAMFVFWATANALMMMAGGSMNDVDRLFSPQETSIRVYFTPAMILSQVFSAALTAVCYTVMLSPPAVAYAALVRD